MSISVDVKRKYKVNGKEYNSIGEMPPEVQAALKDAMDSGPSTFKGAWPAITTSASITFNSTEYPSVEAMPPDVRSLYEAALRSAGVEQVPAGCVVGHIQAPGASKPVTPEPAFSGRGLVISVVLVALGLLIYFLLSAGF